MENESKELVIDLSSLEVEETTAVMGNSWQTWN